MEKEDYLETIFNLQKTHDHVRVSDIAKELNLSKPSVTQMMQRLDKEGCVTYKPYFPLNLTAKGKKIGQAVAERHKVLEEFFTFLAVPEKIQKKDIHGIEHSLSPHTLEKLKKLNKFLKTSTFKST